MQTLVLYSLAEHQLGHASSIEVNALGHSFSVRDNGRGHAIGRAVEGAPYLNFIYSHLSYPFQDRTSKPIQLQGLGMSLLNRLCAQLEVVVRKRSETLTMRFRHGNLVVHELADIESEDTGNQVSGVLSSSFAGSPVEQLELLQWLQIVSQTSPSLRLLYNGQALVAAASGA